MSSVLKLMTCFHWPCLGWVNLGWCVRKGTQNQQRQTCLLIFISVLAQTCTNTHIFLMRLPSQTFIDTVNPTARAVLHSIYLCLIPIKPGLWTSSFSKPINLEGDKIQRQPFGHLFSPLKNKTNQNKAHTSKPLGKPSHMVAWLQENAADICQIYMCGKCGSAWQPAVSLSSAKQLKGVKLFFSTLYIGNYSIRLTVGPRALRLSIQSCFRMSYISENRVLRWDLCKFLLYSLGLLVGFPHCPETLHVFGPRVDSFLFIFLRCCKMIQWHFIKIVVWRQ